MIVKILPKFEVNVFSNDRNLKFFKMSKFLHHNNKTTLRQWQSYSYTEVFFENS